MVKKVFYLQNNGHLSKDPPKQLSKYAKECWRKVVPFLESTNKVQRIDSTLVELYCTQYEIYRKSYEDVQKMAFKLKRINHCKITWAKLLEKTLLDIKESSNWDYERCGYLND